MNKFALGRAETLADLSQGLSFPQLTKEHGNELLPAGKPSSMPLRPMLAHQPPELETRKNLENLAEKAGEWHHRWTSCSLNGFLKITIESTEVRRVPSDRRQYPNLDKSGPRLRFFVETRKRDDGDAGAHRGGALTPYRRKRSERRPESIMNNAG
jgi:hypothetical protein